MQGDRVNPCILAIYNPEKCLHIPAEGTRIPNYVFCLRISTSRGPHIRIEKGSSTVFLPSGPGAVGDVRAPSMELADP